MDAGAHQSGIQTETELRTMWHGSGSRAFLDALSEFVRIRRSFPIWCHDVDEPLLCLLKTPGPTALVQHSTEGPAGTDRITVIE